MMAGFDVVCLTAQLVLNGELDTNRTFSHIDVSLSIVFQRNSGVAARGFSAVHQRAAYRFGRTGHLQVHIKSHILSI